MREPVKFGCLCYLSSRDENIKNISKISSRSCDRWNPTTAMPPQMTRTKENLSMNAVNEYGEKWNGFAEVVAFVT